MTRTRTWRVSTEGRMRAAGLGVAGMMLIVAAGLDEPVDAARLTAHAALGLMFVFVAGWLAWRPFLTVSDEHVLVRNSVRTYRLPLSDVLGVEPHERVSALRLRNGGFVPVWAIENGNRARRLGQGTRGDEVAATVQAANIGRRSV